MLLIGIKKQRAQEEWENLYLMILVVQLHQLLDQHQPHLLQLLLNQLLLYHYHQKNQHLWAVVLQRQQSQHKEMLVLNLLDMVLVQEQID